MTPTATQTSVELKALRVGAKVRILIGAPRVGTVENISRRSTKRPNTYNYRVAYMDGAIERASWFWPCDLERA